MRRVLGLVGLGVAIAGPAWAEQPLLVVYPPANHTTTANQIFLIGTAPKLGEVLVNGQPISRSPAGHFAPSFPLKVGENQFTLRHHNRELKISVTRLSTELPSLSDLSFAKDSLTPAADVARLPGELICFGAVAPTDATVSVKLANQTIPLAPQLQTTQLPENSAVLTQQNQPEIRKTAGQFQGCASTALIGDLGQPEFQLAKDGKLISQLGPGKIEILSPAQLEVAEVTAAAGVARTGPSTDYSRLTPLPQGAQAVITGREGDWLRLDYGAWINRKEAKISLRSVPPRTVIRSVTSRQAGAWTEVVFPLQVPVPISVQQGDRSFTLTLYNTTAQTDTIYLSDDPVITRLDWQQIAPSQVQYRFQLKSDQAWGYKLRYEGTSLILSLRHPPATSGQRPSSQLANKAPLTGVKIVLDPGHGGPEDLGSRGPTGYPEKSVALTVSKLVQAELIRRGATVYMTRETDQDVALQDRVAMINQVEPAIALSLHYNALPDNGNAIKTQGIGTFWYTSQSHGLAMFLHNYLVKTLQRPSYGVFWNNLALTRPTVAPAVLLELGFMINPVEFEWITDATAQKRLAGAIAEGVTQWLAANSSP